MFELFYIFAALGGFVLGGPWMIFVVCLVVCKIVELYVLSNEPSSIYLIDLIIGMHINDAVLDGNVLLVTGWTSNSVIAKHMLGDRTWVSILYGNGKERILLLPEKRKSIFIRWRSIHDILIDIITTMERKKFKDIEDVLSL